MRLEWQSGGVATVEQLESGDRVTLRSTTAAAPGTPLCGNAGTSERYFVKVRTCRRTREEPLEFLLEGRLYNLTKVQRTHLQEALARASANGGSALDAPNVSDSDRS